MVTRMVVEADHHSLNYTSLSAKSQVFSMFHCRNRHGNPLGLGCFQADRAPRQPVLTLQAFLHAFSQFDSLPEQYLLQSL